MINQEFNISNENFYQEHFELVANTYILKEIDRGNKDSEFKRKFLEPRAMKFFKSLGGKETIKQGKKFDLGCTINTSVSPDGQTKKITYFFY